MYRRHCLFLFILTSRSVLRDSLAQDIIICSLRAATEGQPRSKYCLKDALASDYLKSNHKQQNFLELYLDIMIFQVHYIHVCIHMHT